MKKEDIEISRKLKDVAVKVDEIVKRELGPDLGVTLFVHPFAPDEASIEVREFQYISTMDRGHMAGMMRNLLAKWESSEARDIPPHERQ